MGHILYRRTINQVGAILAQPPVKMKRFGFTADRPASHPLSEPLHPAEMFALNCEACFHFGQLVHSVEAMFGLVAWSLTQVNVMGCR
ncbi:MAG: hypothetical protein PVH26_09075 [Desulfosarcina sp.]|jgi:hypothetical protein